MKHVFAISAYRDSPYLEACIRSLKFQTIPVSIILCTSTPSAYLTRLAEQYEIPVYIRTGKSQIQDDWNFAYQSADADLVTIAHQDDMYHKQYAAYVQACWEKYPDTSVMMTDAVIVREKRLMSWDKINFIKKVLRLPLRLTKCADQTWLKKSALLFGNPIICPSCTYHKAQLKGILKGTLFQSAYQFALDWDTMLKLSAVAGRFVCIEKPLLYYRIHAGATTKECIKNHQREQEEQEIFRKLWPRPIAEILLKFYGQSYKSYENLS